MTSILNHLFQSRAHACAALNISDKHYDRLIRPKPRIKHWLMRYMIDRYNVNPLYIYDNHPNMFLNPIT